MMKSSMLFVVGHRPPPYVHLASTRHHSRDKCSQAYPVFFCSSVCVQYNTRRRKSAKKRGRPGNTCHVNDVWWMRGGRRGGGAQLQIRVQ